MAFVSLGNLESLLMNNALEIKYLRRHPKTGHPAFRRMFCTGCHPNFPTDFLRSMPAKIALNYRNPKGVGLPYIPKQKGLVVTWDIFMQDYRTITVNDPKKGNVANLIRVIPIIVTEDQKKKGILGFWDFYNQYIMKMTPAQIDEFMDK